MLIVDAFHQMCIFSPNLNVEFMSITLQFVEVLVFLGKMHHEMLLRFAVVLPNKKKGRRMAVVMAAAAILGCIVCYSTSKKCLQILLISRRRGESRGRLQRSLFRTTQRRIAGGLEMQALSFKQSFFPSFSALLPDVSFFMKCYITFSFTSPS